MGLREIMEAFAAEAGLKDIAADGDGIYLLSIDGMLVSFAEDRAARRLVTFAEVGALPAEGRERLYRLLLEAMYRGGTTGGATFSVPPDSDMICLQRFDGLENMNLAGFKAMLESFVNILEGWRQALADFPSVARRMERDAHEVPEASHDATLGGDGFIRV